MMKFKKWISAHLPTKRRLIQLYAALLFNANLKGFGKGRIYQGNAKYVCTPGLNCYSCPGASGACPLGAMQNALASSNTKLPYYVFGILILYGFLFGRWICGFLCPFGLVQELLHKIKTPKIKKGKLTRILSYFKYVILALFVVILPLMYLFKDMPLPGFCKYICPAGTLGGAIGLLSHSDNAGMFRMLGPLFTWKFLLLVFFVVGSVFMYRFFCRFFCPLGALYGLFNKIALVGVRLEKNKCTDCGLCQSKCKMDICHVGDTECINCGECIDVCPTHAISWKGGKVFMAPSEVEEKGMSKEQSQRLKKRAKIVRFAIGASMVALLAGALYYYNVVDKIPEPSVPSATEEQQPQEGQDPEKDLPPLGNAEGDLCYSTKLPLVEGGEIDLQSLRGKVTVINFWGTWCGPCKEELPDFHALASEYSEQISVVAIHTDYAKDSAQAYIDSNFPDSKMIFAIDSGENYYATLGGVGAYPMTWVLNADGVIVARVEGKISHADLEAAIQAALAD